MNYTLIISVLLGIVALHIILDNFQYLKTFEGMDRETSYDGNNYSETEGEFEAKTFQNVINTVNTKRKEQKLAYAAGESFTSEMDELLQSLSPQTQVQKQGTVPANYDPATTDDANFHSNVMDIPNFYKENKLPQYDGQSNLNSIQAGTHQRMEEQTDKVSKQPAYMYEANGSKAFKPDSWEYQNELPMNGGKMENGVVGFDLMDGGGGFAVYDQSTVVQSIPSNDTDLRNGMGIPQKYDDQFR